MVGDENCHRPNSFNKFTQFRSKIYSKKGKFSDKEWHEDIKRSLCFRSERDIRFGQVMGILERIPS